MWSYGKTERRGRGRSPTNESEPDIGPQLTQEGATLVLRSQTLDQARDARLAQAAKGASAHLDAVVDRPREVL
jgi:hypothetical protein